MTDRFGQASLLQYVDCISTGNLGMFGDIQGLGHSCIVYRIRLDEIRQCILAYICTKDRSSTSVLLQIQPRTQNNAQSTPY